MFDLVGSHAQVLRIKEGKVREAREAAFLFLEDLILLLSVEGFCLPHGPYFNTVEKSL